MKPLLVSSFIAFFVFVSIVSTVAQSASTTENKVWSKTPDGHKATFYLNGIQNHIYYDDDGSWLATMRYLPIQLIPFTVRELIKKAYPGYLIFFAQDIKTAEGVSWVIKIENPIGWKTLGIRDGEIIVKESFEKN